MATLFKDGYFQPNDTVGRTLGGARLYFYTAGTTSPKNTYTSSALTATNQHPVEADAAGRFPPIWLDGTYDVELKDSDDVLIDSWENVNNTDSAINATAPLQFKTLADLKTLTAQNDVVVDPEIGDALHTTGKTNTQDDEGADWVVVAAGTGTPDDDTYVDLSNGLQAERIFNHLYRKNNGSDIENAATFRSNISAIENGTGTVSNTNLASNAVTTPKIASNAVTTPKIADNNVTAAKLATGDPEDDWVADRIVATAGSDTIITSPDAIRFTGGGTVPSPVDTVKPDAGLSVVSTTTAIAYLGGMLINISGTVRYGYRVKKFSGSANPDVYLYRQRSTGDEFADQTGGWNSSSSLIDTYATSSTSFETNTVDVSVQVGDILYVALDAEDVDTSIDSIWVGVDADSLIFASPWFWLNISP